VNDTLTIVFICIGLIFVGGVISFMKQGLPKGVVVLLGIAAAMFIALGVLRWIGKSS
jgi:hypothetical protein